MQPKVDKDSKIDYDLNESAMSYEQKSEKSVGKRAKHIHMIIPCTA